MEIKPASIFEVKRLGTEPLSQADTKTLATLQKTLKKLYFAYQKSVATNPDLPPHRILAGPQGMAISPTSPDDPKGPGAPTCETFYPKETILASYAVQFVSVGDKKGKKFKVAFEPIDSDQNRGKENLYFSLESKETYMTTATHHPLFVTVLRRTPPNKKLVDLHVYVCLCEAQATDVIRALKGELKPAEAPQPAGMNNNQYPAGTMPPGPQSDPTRPPGAPFQAGFPPQQNIAVVNGEPQKMPYYPDSAPRGDFAVYSSGSQSGPQGFNPNYGYGQPGPQDVYMHGYGGAYPPPGQMHPQYNMQGMAREPMYSTLPAGVRPDFNGGQYQGQPYSVQPGMSDDLRARPEWNGQVASRPYSAPNGVPGEQSATMGTQQPFNYPPSSHQMEYNRVYPGNDPSMGIYETANRIYPTQMDMGYRPPGNYPPHPENIYGIQRQTYPNEPQYPQAGAYGAVRGPPPGGNYQYHPGSVDPNRANFDPQRGVYDRGPPSASFDPTKGSVEPTFEPQKLAPTPSVASADYQRKTYDSANMDSARGIYDISPTSSASVEFNNAYVTRPEHPYNNTLPMNQPPGEWPRSLPSSELPRNLPPIDMQRNQILQDTNTTYTLKRNNNETNSVKSQDGDSGAPRDPVLSDSVFSSSTPTPTPGSNTENVHLKSASVSEHKTLPTPAVRPGNPSRTMSDSDAIRPAQRLPISTLERSGSSSNTIPEDSPFVEPTGNSSQRPVALVQPRKVRGICVLPPSGMLSTGKTPSLSSSASNASDTTVNRTPSSESEKRPPSTEQVVKHKPIPSLPPNKSGSMAAPASKELGKSADEGQLKKEEELGTMFGNLKTDGGVEPEAAESTSRATDFEKSLGYLP